MITKKGVDELYENYSLRQVRGFLVLNAWYSKAKEDFGSREDPVSMYHRMKNEGKL